MDRYHMISILFHHMPCHPTILSLSGSDTRLWRQYKGPNIGVELVTYPLVYDTRYTFPERSFCVSGNITDQYVGSNTSLWMARLQCVFSTLQWRHNGRDGVPNHKLHDCLLNRLFRRRSKKTPKLHVTGLCAEKSSATGEFPVQMASNA